MSQVLVTGGAGFIGAHLVRALVKRGDDVLVMDNLITGTAENLSLALDLPLPQVQATLHEAHGRILPLAAQCQVLVGDIRDSSLVSKACQGIEVVFHQAALRSVPRSLIDPTGTHEVNATGTQRLLEAARLSGVRRVVFASSSSVYGDTPLPKHEGQVPQPKSPYAASKLAGEAYCQVYSRSFGLSAISLRYFNVFGPWQDPNSEYAAVIPRFIRLALERRPLPIHGDGYQSRDFTYVDNVIDANIAVSDADVDGFVINVGVGSRHTILELIHHIEEILGYRVSRVHLPDRRGDVKHTEADITLARNVLRYEPRVDFATGLRHMIESMRIIGQPSMTDTGVS